MDQDHKHQCKFCSKIFSCGRSLGGHMRSHLEAKGKLKESGGYELRENPKKNLRLFGLATSSSDQREKLCGECGKEFQSWKALFGHMRCHSKKVARKVEEEEDEGSFSNRSLIKGSIALKVPKKKKRSRRAFSYSSSYSSSSSMFEYSKEQEDVAISLMMLSRDVGYWGFNFNHVGESSDKISAVSEDHQDLAVDDLGSLKSKKLDSDCVSDSEYFELLEGAKIELDASDSKLGSRSKYECTTCNRSFNTPQALGGHRASHKRMKGFDARIDRVEGNEDVGVIKGNHQCLICGKVFGSGQALGGHKRWHFAMASPNVVIQQEEDLIDLNLPAPIEESVSVDLDVDEYNSWWVGSNLEGKEMVGMIAN